MILTNGSMACGHMGKASTQYISEPYKREPRATFSIGGFNSVLFFILKVQEELSFLLTRGK